MAGLFTYHDGASAAAPPDTRNLTRIGRPDYATLSTGDQSTYTGGSGRVVTYARNAGTNTMVLGYDLLGRRAFEYDSFDPVRSRRDYTYLPNGQLATITGKTPAGAAYAVSINYDHAGLPLTMIFATAGAPTATYEYFFDDASRLVNLRVAQSELNGQTVWTWHYHYLGDQVIAATRERQVGTATPVVQRYWTEYDERGLIYALVQNQGVKDFVASYDASGWRRITTQVGGIDNHVPFGLPGQIYLERQPNNGAIAGNNSAAAYASGAGFTHTRPPLMLNQWRVYDPLLGAYLQPDGADRSGRRDPEGYAYARNSAIGVFDVTGLDSTYALPNPQNKFTRSCAAHADSIRKALRIAYYVIQDCVSGPCGKSESTRRAWQAQLQMGTHVCSDFGFFNNWLWARKGAYTRGYGENSMVDVSPDLLRGDLACLAQTFAHEALHRADNAGGISWGVIYPKGAFRLINYGFRNRDQEERFVKSATTHCFFGHGVCADLDENEHLRFIHMYGSNRLDEEITHDWW